MLALKDIKTEQYLGGAAAIARHISPFCGKITLLSMLGEKKEFLKEVKNSLPKNVRFDYINKKNSPTIVKKRFLDHVSKNDEKIFSKKLSKLISVHDVVIVSDYGHGLISEKSSKFICKKSKYLALNAQINAANLGYHSMKKYKNFDFFINNEAEIRHEMRDIKSKTEALIKKLSSKQNIKNLIVTSGKEAALI